MRRRSWNLFEFLILRRVPLNKLVDSMMCREHVGQKHLHPGEDHICNEDEI